MKAKTIAITVPAILPTNPKSYPLVMAPPVNTASSGDWKRKH